LIHNPGVATATSHVQYIIQRDGHGVCYISTDRQWQIAVGQEASGKKTDKHLNGTGTGSRMQESWFSIELSLKE